MSLVIIRRLDMPTSTELREKAQRYRQMALRITNQKIAQAIYELANEYDDKADQTERL